MSKNLLIVFVKNSILGKVKTRLAKTIGDVGAYKIYAELFSITEEASQKIEVDRHIYFSDVIIPSKWEKDQKFVQYGEDLGARMKNAFQHGFENNYDRIILIGSDLPTISEKIIAEGFKRLETNDAVFGPAEDGGYYLIGLSKMNNAIFEKKPWSQSTLLTVTLQELSEQKTTVSLLDTLNDIDTFEDLIASDFYKNNKHIQEIVKHLNSTTN
jgi:hypothetical protein